MVPTSFTLTPVVGSSNSSSWEAWRQVQVTLGGAGRDCATKAWHVVTNKEAKANQDNTLIIIRTDLFE
jgi:hypothetical protein